MRRSRGIPTLLLALSALAAAPGGSVAVAQEKPARLLTWPPPPAEPLVRLDGVVKKLSGFEVAIQGSAAGALRRVDKLKRPAGIDFDDRGRLLVTDSRQGLLLRVDLDLGVVLVFGTATQPSLERPLGVASGAAGTIFVADGDLGEVVAFSTDGKVVATYGGGSLTEPVDVALSADGKRLFVADSKADSVVTFDVASRSRIDSFGGRGKGAAEFHGPAAIEVDGDGNLLVVDRLNARVQLFDPQGAFTRALYSTDSSSFSRPRDVAVDSIGRVFVTDEAHSLVRVYGSDLEPLLEFGRNGLGNGEFLGIGGIVASGDRLAVVDHAGGRVQTFHLYGAKPAPARAEPALAPAVTVADTVSGESGEVSEPQSPSAEAGTTQGASPADSTTDSEPPPVAAAPTPEPAAAVAAPEVDAESPLIDLINDWAAAWSAQDVERYLTFYGNDFLPANGDSRERWSEQRRQRIVAPASIEVTIEKAEVDLLGPERAEVTFLQSYRSERFSDRVRKVLVMVCEAGGWKIAAETVLETI